MQRKMIILGSILLVPVIFLAGLTFPRIVNFEGQTTPFDAYKVAPNSNSEDLYWANEIVKGDRELLLWFRHGEREKWTGTVTVFDYFHVNKSEESFPGAWRPAVCLTQKGIAESQIVGATFRELEIEVSHVITSPSCRAKETAIEAFGGYDEEWIEILHATAVTSQQQKVFAERLRSKVVKSFQDSIGTKGNIVVTGHGNTLPFYAGTIFDATEIDDWNLSELGFVVIEKSENRLIARHAFIEFYEFANALLQYKG
jgi:phosphohistidine phosphatase SixA